LHLAVIAAQHTSQLWPTLSRVGTLVAAVAGTYAGFKARGGQKHTLEVKSIVNGNFTTKVQELTDTTQELKETAAELASARAELAAVNHATAPPTSTPLPPASESQ
jgi:hypothetical protein